MKKLRLILSGLAVSALIMLTGCHHFNDWDDDYDDYAPSAPQNVRAYAGDNVVDIYWDRNPEHDIAGYNIYYSYSYRGKYTLIGTTQGTHYVDDGASNGETYYYAIAAYDFDGNESDLSMDVVYNTPRPEGYNQAIFDYNITPDKAGYSFANYAVVPYNDKAADIFFENYNGVNYIDVWAADTDIQDMGLTNDIYDIPEAPTNGWIPVQPGDNIKYAEAKVGHTYVIWTQGNHYAKIRISRITSERIVFDWVYQVQIGNTQLKQAKTSSIRNSMPAKIERKY
jgi:hypothetical protein